MPFQPINFANIAPQGNPLAKDLVENLMHSVQSGFQLSKMPEQYEINKRSEMMKNALQEQKTNKIRKDLQNPFYGIPSGEGGQSVLFQKLMEDPNFAPAFKDLLEKKEIGNRNTESNIDFRNKLVATMDKGKATGIGKLGLELDEINNGTKPGSNGEIKLTPNEQKQMQGQWELKIQKETAQPDVLKRNLFASNIEKTLETFDPKDLFQYGGLQGQALLKIDQAKSAIGKPSDSFIKYEAAKTAVDVLADQVRQFYGTSITKGVRDDLKHLTNPSNWINNPTVSLAKYNSLKNILTKEMQTYRGAGESTAEYQGKGNSIIPPPFGTQEPTSLNKPPKKSPVDLSKYLPK